MDPTGGKPTLVSFSSFAAEGRPRNKETLLDAFSSKVELQKLNKGKEPYYMKSSGVWECMARGFARGESFLVGQKWCRSLEEAEEQEEEILAKAFSNGEFVMLDDKPFKSFAAIDQWDETGKFLPLEKQPLDTEANNSSQTIESKESRQYSAKEQWND